MSTGSIMGWLNSDDLLLPGALTAVDRVFREIPHADWITGRSSALSHDGMLWSIQPARPWSWLRFVMQDCRHIQQESTFWRRSLWTAAGGRLDEDYGIAGDFELWTRFFEQAHLHTVDLALGAFRFRNNGQLSRPGNGGLSAHYEHQTQRAIAKLGRSVPLPRMAECIDVLNVNPPVQPSGRFHEIAQSLTAADPTVIRYDRQRDHFTALSWPSGAGQPGYDEAPLAAVTWCDLNFQPLHHRPTPTLTTLPSVAAVDTSRERELVGFDVLLDPEAQAHRPGSAAPGTPVVVGPVAVHSLPDGGYRCTLAGINQTVELPVSASGRLHLRVVTAHGRYAVLADGLTVGVGEVTLPPFTLDRVVLGGTPSAPWYGVVDSVALWSRPAGSSDRPPSCVEVRHACRQAGSTARGPARSDADPAGIALEGLGRRMFVLGADPALSEVDGDRLTDDCLFACDEAFTLLDGETLRPTHYTCIDEGLLVDRAADIRSVLDRRPRVRAVFPARVTLPDGGHCDTRRLIPPAPNRWFIDSPAMQPDSATATMVMLAAHMGFSPIYLVGRHMGPIAPLQRVRRLLASSQVKVLDAGTGAPLRIFEQVDFADLFYARSRSARPAARS